MAKQDKKVKVTMIASKFGRKPGHRECLHGLGLKRMHQTVEIIDTPANRGMINKINYLVKVEEL